MMSVNRLQAGCLRQKVVSAVALCGLGLSASDGLAAAPADGNALRQSARDRNAEIVMKITAPFTVAAVGDILMPQPLNREEPGFQKLTDLIRKADVGFGNMESSLVDFRHFDGPIDGSQAPLEMGEALKTMGITMMSRANNHTFDGGVAGMISTDDMLDRLGITHAGTGRNLQAARAPRYRETPKGRVGLVSMFSLDDVGSYGRMYAKAEATYREGDHGGAPGMNPLHLTTHRVIRPEQLQVLKDIAGSVYGERVNVLRPAGEGKPERFRFFGEWYEAGSEVGALHYEMNPNDARDILHSIRNGKVVSDFMIATIHVHQVSDYRNIVAGERIGMREGWDHGTPDFMIRLAHDSIDNGADMFVAHGVHSLRGVEIYKDKPVFYGLSNFVFQSGIEVEPHDVLASAARRPSGDFPATRDALLATSHFDNGRLTEVRLYPADLGGTSRPLSRNGIPATPSPEDAQRILKAVQEYSKPFGTRITIENNIGVIRLGADGQSTGR